MPISFAQPSPVGGYQQHAGGSSEQNARVYASLANAAQDRYASERASAGREQLGYAQLDQEYALKRQALGLQEAEIAQRPGLQAEAIQMRARAEMDQWVQQQQFTQRDQMELNRQRAALGELLTKRDSGEVSEEEFYQMSGRIAPRVNSLAEREKFTQQQAAELQKRAMADNYQSQVRMRDDALTFKRAEDEGKLQYHIPPRYKLELAEMMKDAHPELASGSAAYDAMLTMLADEMGYTERYAKNAKGEMVFEKQVKGAAGAGEGGAGKAPASPTGKGGTELDAAHVQTSYESARKHITGLSREKNAEGGLLHPELQDPATFNEKVKAEFDAQVAAVGGHFAGKGEGPAKQHQAALEETDKKIRDVAQNPNLGSAAKLMVGEDLKKLRDLVAKYPPGKKVPKAVADRILALRGRVEQYNLGYSVPGGDSGAAGATPQTLPPEAVQTTPEQSVWDVGWGRVKGALSRPAAPSGGGGY